ncbi:MAG TPA: NYN domain-containing protein [Candidatus Eisenbacteria bacterium]|jgi:predicted RNA-binding protein with PIN domain
MQPRLVILDGYNLILRSPRLKPGANRTLRESREKLVNLLSWMMGANDVRYLVVFDGAEGGGRDEPSGRVQVTYSRPPDKADDVIRRLVEKRVGGDEAITVVTSDIEVARHARAMGADISLADLFLAAALGDAGRAGGEAPDGQPEAPEKPVSLSKKELEEWAELFRQRRTPMPDAGGEPEN